MGDVKKEVNKAFQTTFRTIFGECNIQMDDISDYLWRYHEPIGKRKSSVSGKDVFIADSRYCQGARIISEDEIDFKSAPALDINEIKDIDSIVEAAREQMQYAGNKVFGKAEMIDATDTATDVFFLSNAHHVSASKYVGYSSYIRMNSEYAFGSSYFLRSKHVIKVIAADSLTRCFETYISTNGSDLFFCYDCNGCSHAMFSFNLRSKNYVIGNLELPKDKYFALRKKLIDESREYIEKNKTFYSMFESLPPLKIKPAISVKRKPKPAEDFKPLDEAWKTACRVMLGKDIGPLRKYEKFLSERVNPVTKVKTAFGNETHTSDIFFYKHIPKERTVCAEEAEEIAKQHLTFEDGEEVNLKSVLGKISPFALFRVDFHEGSNANNIETHIAYTATNTYKVCDGTYAKNCAYDTMALNSEYVFGSYRTLYSKFCIKCHAGLELSNCFDTDCCTYTRDSYFSHNCESVDNSMFCFNTKSKRYAVGNVEIGKENYMKVKKIVLDEITAKLEKDGTLPFDIFTLGCYKQLKK